MEVEKSSYIEGFGDDAVLVFSVLTLVTILTMIFYCKKRKGTYDIRPTVADASQRSSDPCPICLDEICYPVQTNCGHLFCGSCILACWDSASWLLNPLPCPLCRQTVTLVFLNFTESEFSSVSEDQPTLVSRIEEYNRRFSGAPRPLLDYLYDIPTLISQMWSDTGLDALMRFRIYAYFALALIYLLMPMDILPEAVFGMAGIIDDVVVVVIIALYLTNTYRTYVAYRNIRPLVNGLGGSHGFMEDALGLDDH